MIYHEIGQAALDWARADREADGQADRVESIEHAIAASPSAMLEDYDRAELERVKLAMAKACELEGACEQAMHAAARKLLAELDRTGP